MRTTNLATGTIEYFGYGQDGRLLQDWSNRRGVRNGYIYLGNTLVGLYEVTLAGGAVNARYKHTDALGSPVVTTDASKAILNRTSYTPYGAPTAPVDGVGYTGHFIDVGTSLTYMQQRYYDPQIGRFLTVDPVKVQTAAGANFNRYGYASSNPYRFIDPDGRSAQTWTETLAQVLTNVFAGGTESGDTRAAAKSLGSETAAEVPDKQDSKTAAIDVKNTVASAAKAGGQVVTNIGVCAVATVVGLDAKSIAQNTAKEGAIRGAEHIVKTNGAKEMSESGLGALVKGIPIVKAAFIVSDVNAFFTCAGERTVEETRNEN